ncbi:PROTEIN RER1 [Salix koriyanagi]|uniref:PROTEIN RER1 n=1 Tax=Salix koriyanagi TaxID=2511006 RepID=A0A9Q0P5E4_9ROSI|nr:PROTEIN RER1 [Salix koriyanagi]
METGQPSGTLSGNDLSSLSSTPATTISRCSYAVSRRYQHFLDQTVPHVLYRWLSCLIVVLIYAIRVYLVQGFYIITYSITKAFCIAFVMTFFFVFDVPVFWPILLIYWVMLFLLTMRRQISHMIKYRYVPFSTGKQRYDGKKGPSTKTADLPKE